MSLLSHLTEITGDAFATLGLDRDLGQVVPSQRPELSQFQCNGALAGAQVAGRSPREIAEAVAAKLRQEPEIEEASVAGPGFININLTSESLAEWSDITASDPRLGLPPTSDPKSVVVDYAGPNVAKAMHVGHLRATIIGDSLARLFGFAGHQVTRDPHFGDWGFQMGLLIAAIAERQPSLPYFEDDPGELPLQSPVTLADLQEIYPEASSRARSDEEFATRSREATVKLQQGHRGYRALWQQMKTVSEESQRQDFAALGVTFDLWYGESDVNERIEPLVSRIVDSGVARESDGALVVDVAEDGDSREIPPLILRTTAGGYLYSTTDLATIEMRVNDLGADLILYVVDRRQADHFLQLFRAARRAGIAREGVTLEHIGFGTMNGPDGKPFRTREGGVVRLGDLIEMVTVAAAKKLEENHLAEGYDDDERAEIARQVGLAALKFGDLINNRSSDYTFDLDRFSAFEGKTGPYLQYAAVRINSLLRRADAAGLGSGPMLPPAGPAEERLMLALLRIPEVVERALELRAPNHVADHAFETAGAFSNFYETFHILSESRADRQSSWLRLCQWTLDSLRLLLDLLGIEVPDRM